MPTVRVGRIVPRTEAEGPRARFTLWVQGCSIRCRGCFNPQFFAVRGGTAMTVDDLLKAVPATGIEGVTLLGGEPFEQAPALAVFARAVRDRGLSVMSFSGATLDELQSRAQQGEPVGDRLEVRIAADGTTSVNGWADTAGLERLLDGLRAAPRSSSSGLTV